MNGQSGNKKKKHGFCHSALTWRMVVCAKRTTQLVLNLDCIILHLLCWACCRSFSEKRTSQLVLNTNSVILHSLRSWYFFLSFSALGSEIHNQLVLNINFVFLYSRVAISSAKVSTQVSTLIVISLLTWFTCSASYKEHQQVSITCCHHIDCHSGTHIQLHEVQLV